MGDIVPTSVGGIKTAIFFALKVIVALAVLNMIAKPLLGFSVGLFIEDPIGTVQAAFSKVSSKVTG